MPKKTYELYKKEDLGWSKIAYHANVFPCVLTEGTPHPNPSSTHYASSIDELASSFVRYGHIPSDGITTTLPVAAPVIEGGIMKTPLSSAELAKFYKRFEIHYLNEYLGFERFK